MKCWKSVTLLRSFDIMPTTFSNQQHEREVFSYPKSAIYPLTIQITKTETYQTCNVAAAKLRQIVEWRKSAIDWRGPELLLIGAQKRKKEKRKKKNQREKRKKEKSERSQESKDHHKSQLLLCGLPSCLTQSSERKRESRFHLSNIIAR